MTASDGAAGDGAGVIADRYRLMSELGRGAMGVVWLARDERLGRTVAVKVLRPGVGLGGAGDTQAHHSQLRARREARIAARLHHPHAVAVFDVVDHDGRPCLVMEYVPSRSLAEVLADGTVLAPAVAAELGEQVASALSAAHDAGIVHRDVKPGNILLTEDGTAKLTDFGISRASGDVTVTATGEMLGTPAYFAPEVARGQAAAPASDVFSLGATLYAATEGVPPFGLGPTAMALLLRIVNDEIRQPEQTGPLADTLMWMLRNDPADRPSLEEVRQALRALAAALPQPEAPIPPVPASVPVPQSTDTSPDAARNPAPGTASSAGSQAPSTASDAASAADAPPERAASDGRPEAAAASAVPVAPAQPSSERTRTYASRRRRLLPFVLLGVVGVVTAGVVAAIVASNGPSGSTASHAPTASAAQTSHPGVSTQSTGAGGSGSKTTTPSATSGSQTSASPSSPASPTNSPTSVSAQLTSTISTYYTLVPGNLDQAWGYMTADYQQNHAGGFTNYSKFWQPIESVKLSDMVVKQPSTVVVTIDYHYKDGHTVQERTSLGLVKSGSAWKIASSSVLSSQTL